MWVFRYRRMKTSTKTYNSPPDECNFPKRKLVFLHDSKNTTLIFPLDPRTSLFHVRVTTLLGRYEIHTSRKVYDFVCLSLVSSIVFHATLEYDDP